MKKIISVLIYFLSIQSFYSQVYSCDIKFLNKSVNYSFVQSYYEKDTEIESIIKNITGNVGLQPNFISLSYPNFKNCAAINLNGFRYTLNPQA